MINTCYAKEHAPELMHVMSRIMRWDWRILYQEHASGLAHVTLRNMRKDCRMLRQETCAQISIYYMCQN